MSEDLLLDDSVDFVLDAASFDDEDELSDDAPDVDDAVESVPFASAPVLLLSRKSVTYQPPPLRWKAAAEISFLTSPPLPHSHSVSSASLNFWIFSKTSPHLWHSYS